MQLMPGGTQRGGGGVGRHSRHLTYVNDLLFLNSLTCTFGVPVQIQYIYCFTIKPVLAFSSLVD